MKRRFFLKLLAGLGGVITGIFGIKRCSMNQTVSYLVKDNLPPVIKIDDMGWAAFLQKWNDEIISLVKKQVLHYRLDFDWIQSSLRERGVQFQDDLFSERLVFPPRTATEKINASQIMKFMVDSIIHKKNKISKEMQIVAGNNFVEEVLLHGGLLYPPADKAIIEKVEQRLQMILPSSYKEFLLVSNGFLNVHGRLLPVNEIDWLRVRDKETMEAWWVEGREPEWTIPDSEYCDYEAHGVYGGSEATRVEYLEHCLQIGDENQVRGASLWLLNPVIQIALDDWEAWVWDPSVPGIPRYRNFKEMMEIRYRVDVASLRIDLLYLEEEFKKSRGVRPSKVDNSSG